MLGRLTGLDACGTVGAKRGEGGDFLFFALHAETALGCPS